jgi:hypothetical protein
MPTLSGGFGAGEGITNLTEAENASYDGYCKCFERLAARSRFRERFGELVKLRKVHHFPSFCDTNATLGHGTKSYPKYA